jgi:hypothetical protein
MIASITVTLAPVRTPRQATDRPTLGRAPSAAASAALAYRFDPGP